MPDGNKRTAFLAMVEFAERNGLTWLPFDEDDVVETMLAVAAGSLMEPDFVEWVALQLAALIERAWSRRDRRIDVGE